jgi:hypothetical protein
MANRRSLEEKIERLKQMAALGLAETEHLLGVDRQHKWSIPDRKIAMKYLIAVKQGMHPRQWVALHPVEWERLVEIAPLKRRNPGSVEGVPQNVLNGAWHDALEVLGTALTIERERRLQSWGSGVLAAMAAAHLGIGDFARALTLAEEAIAVSRRSGARLREFSALLTRMRALRETQGLQATREIEAALAEADAWLEMSGAKSYAPFLCVERAEFARLSGDEATRQRELREAHRLFLEIGAPIRAAEVARSSSHEVRPCWMSNRGNEVSAPIRYER